MLYLCHQEHQQRKFMQVFWPLWNARKYACPHKHINTDSQYQISVKIKVCARVMGRKWNRKSEDACWYKQTSVNIFVAYKSVWERMPLNQHPLSASFSVWVCVLGHLSWNTRIHACKNYVCVYISIYVRIYLCMCVYMTTSLFTFIISRKHKWMYTNNHRKSQVYLCKRLSIRTAELVVQKCKKYKAHLRKLIDVRWFKSRNADIVWTHHVDLPTFNSTFL